MIEVRFTPTRAEVTGPARAELMRKPAMIAICVIVVAGLVFGIATADPAAIAGFAVCALYVGYVIVSIPARAWRRYTEVAPGEVTYRIGEDGLQASVTSTSSTSDWTLFCGASRSGDVYVVRMKGNRRLMIPTRAFAAPADEQAFRELVGRKLGATL
jgi:hypothetical protein